MAVPAAAKGYSGCMAPYKVLAYCDYRHQASPATPLLLLAQSLRAFGGASASWPFWVLVGEGREVPAGDLALAWDLGVEFLSYRTHGAGIGPAGAGLPFGSKALAAAEAERRAAALGRSRGEEVFLLWMDRDSLVLGDLSPLVLGPGLDLGYRPVNKATIGLPAGTEPNAYWSRVLALGGFLPGPGQEEEAAQVLGRTRAWLGGPDLLFYICAGILGVRPGLGILSAWAAFQEILAADPVLSAARSGSAIQTLFLHQVALSLAAASLVQPSARLEYPPSVLYPLNLHGEAPGALRARSLEALPCLRYDSALDGPAWRDLPWGPGLRAWLESRLD